MGIKDLLRFMKPFIEPVHIKKYSGKRVGIDAYSWLHKGAYSCSMELCLDTEGKKKLRYIDYFMHRINLLRHYKIVPVVVFDGGNIPCKADTEHDRHRRRKANRDLAMERLKEGNVRAASELFQRAISVTPAMAHQLIQILKSENIEYMVAPYEADAQLAYLASLEAAKGGVAAVITEDSDLLAYGCKAIVFKMDRYGNGDELLLENVFMSADKKPSFQNFDKELFAGMCVLAGCDFLPSIPGIGIAKAHSFVSKYRNLDRVLSVLKIEKGNQMPEEYSKSFREAVAVFQHARVYDSDSKKLKHLKPLTENLLELLDGELDFLGPELPDSIATAIAAGNLDPINMEAFNSFPNSGCNWDQVSQPSGRFHKPRTAESSVQDTSFSASSSRSLIRESMELEKAEPSITKGKVKKDLDQILTRRKCSIEDSSFHKLILQPKDYMTVESADAGHFTPLKVPSNNPFKRIKVEEISLEQMKNATKEELEVSFGAQEHSEICFLASKECLSMSTDNVLPSQNGKERAVNSKQTDNGSPDQVSVVTEAAVSCVVNSESQESVSSKTRTASRANGRGKNKNSPASKISILNFFRRV